MEKSAPRESLSADKGVLISVSGARRPRRTKLMRNQCAPPPSVAGGAICMSSSFPTRSFCWNCSSSWMPRLLPPCHAVALGTLGSARHMRHAQPETGPACGTIGTVCTDRSLLFFFSLQSKLPDGKAKNGPTWPGAAVIMYTALLRPRAVRGARHVSGVRPLRLHMRLRGFLQLPRQQLLPHARLLYAGAGYHLPGDGAIQIRQVLFKTVEGFGAVA